MEMKMEEARSPVETNHPWAQHMELPMTTPSLASQAALRRKAMACWASAKSRFRMRTRNWLGGSSRMRCQTLVLGSSCGTGPAGCGHRCSSGRSCS